MERIRVRERRGARERVFRWQEKDYGSRQKSISSLKKEKQFDVQGKATTFFFTNFPEDWNEAKLWRSFEEYGRLVDLYVARKKTIRGRKFGFVRFFHVSNAGYLEQKLDGKQMGNFRINVNIARFERRMKEPRFFNRIQKPPQPPPATSRCDGPRKSYVVNGRTFAEVVRGQGNAILNVENT